MILFIYVMYALSDIIFLQIFLEIYIQIYMKDKNKFIRKKTDNMMKYSSFESTKEKEVQLTEANMLRINKYNF